MGYKDHEKISAEDVSLLETLVVDYYQKPYEESYQLLRKKLAAKFRGKDTNSKYSSILLGDLEDLILTVIFRLISINSKLLKKGERIQDLELMANRIADFVYQEELRAIRKHLDEPPLNENDPESKIPPIPQRVDDEIQAIKGEMTRKCYEICVERLPADNRRIFQDYYPNVALEPKELVARRKRLANEVAGLTPAQAERQTPEQEERTLNNLQSKVNKWRKTHIEQCVKKCIEAEASRHPRLNYLNQQ